MLFWTSQAESPKIPTQIPKYFGPFLTSWLDLVAARRSGLKKAARGSPRIQIWSHEGLNQAQNHVLASPGPKQHQCAFQNPRTVASKSLADYKTPGLSFISSSFPLKPPRGVPKKSERRRPRLQERTFKLDLIARRTKRNDFPVGLIPPTSEICFAH